MGVGGGRGWRLPHALEAIRPALLPCARTPALVEHLWLCSPGEANDPCAAISGHVGERQRRDITGAEEPGP